MDFDTVLIPGRRADMAARGLWPDRTVNDYLDECVAKRPDKLALTALIALPLYWALAPTAAALGRLALADLADLPSDVHGNADYRRRIGAVMVARAWRDAVAEARSG